ncbi:hypothetical protein [Pseudomonas psychrophila]|uniref:hypothetical protein n=1 Tax=Pseudomonas psychrophila TaxID=122355 RepID=UPI001F0AFCDD|nr:hypothetical protein [Pseudomonas psychrophila]
MFLWTSWCKAILCVVDHQDEVSCLSGRAALYPCARNWYKYCSLIQLFAMTPYVVDPLAEWHAASKQRFDLVTDPESHWCKLVDLAMLAYERHQVRSDELSEMLELADAARLWGLVEWEEADGVGLFLDHSIDPDDVSFFLKRGR